MTDAVLGNTYQLPASAWESIVKRGEVTSIGKQDKVTSINYNNKMYLYPNKYKYDVEKPSPLLLNAQESIRVASEKYWPILEHISMFSFRLTTKGMREPHWYPETAEMGYAVKGHARMTVLSPTGNNPLSTYELKAGDVYFVPRVYPNNIENIGRTELHMLVFWDQSVNGDISFTSAFSAYSREVIASALQCSSKKLPIVPFYPRSLLIVKRLNPLDP